MKDEIEYIKIEEVNLPNAENIQDDFQYWKWIERLNSQQVINADTWLIKVSWADRNSFYLNDKIEVWWWISKTTNVSDIVLKYNNTMPFWDWSDWDLILNVCWTYQIESWNYNNVILSCDSWIWTLFCALTDKPIIINCLWDFILNNVQIDFSWRFTWDNKYTIQNFLWNTLELDWNKWYFWAWWWWWNSWKWWNNSSWWCIRADTTSWNWATWINWWWSWWNWIVSIYAWWNADLTIWNWKPWNSFMWWNWWRGYDAWCWLAWEWVWLWATTLWWNWNNWSWYPSWWGWWWWWEWWKWWVPLILNVKWNIILSTVKLNWWTWWTWWNWWNWWNWLYSNWYWAWWWWWGWWWWAWWNWWWLYINYWWELTFSSSNFQSNWWAWWTWWSAWQTEWTLPPYPKASNWTTWTSWTYSIKKVVNAF